LKNRRFLNLTLGALVSTAGCDTSDDAAVGDVDRDGITEAAGDCDDFNNRVFPGATEILGDGIDQDCSGADSPALAPTDIDGDGVTAADGDCNDKNDSVFPAAVDLPGDGIDQDCSGADTPAGATSDVDKDGVTAADGDCDDLNRAVFPGARERTGDGVDSNCDDNEMPALGPDRFADALGIMDTDDDGGISFEEFSAACAISARLDGDAKPGVVQTHSSCAGTGGCQGMHMHPWNELFVHDCRGLNGCTGWSCVQTADDKGRTGAVAYVEAGCTNCHTGKDGAFKIEVTPGQDPEQVKAAFLARSDARFRSAIAFGIAGISPGEVAYSNMPAHYDKLSLREIDAVIAHVRSLPLEAVNFEWGDDIIPDEPGEGGGHGGM
jgi:hypothetical protein